MRMLSPPRGIAGALALGAMLAMTCGGAANAQPADDETGSLTVNGSGVHSNSLASPQYSSDTDPLEFSMWELCDIENVKVIGIGGNAFGGCQEVLVRGGQMNIGDLEVPIPDGSLQVAGGSRPVLNPVGFPTGESSFVPALNSEHGVFHRDLPVPGGAFGGSADMINLTAVSASVEAVGLPDLRALDLAIDMPVRIKLENPLLGNSCYIGSEQDPIMLNIRPDDGGETILVEDRYGEGVPGVLIEGATGSDNNFAVPAASGCGLGGSLNWLVNWRANTPSPAGDNSITVQFDAMDAGVAMVEGWRNTSE